MSIIISIALEIIKLSKSKLERNYKVTKLLKEFNLIELKNNFNSVYAHTLVRFGVDKNTLIVELFADKNIVNAFKTELYDKESGEFKAEIIYSYYHGKPDLKREFPDFKVIKKEIDIFREKFKYITNRSRTPSELELYNKINHLEQMEYERRFEYQVEQYLKRLVDDFSIEFLEQDHYIDLNGEIVLKKRELYKLGEKLAEKEKEKIEKIEKIKYEPIDKYLNQWINDNSQNFLAVMGEYGTGKTTLCRHIIHGLAADFLGQNTDDNNILKDEYRRIPLLFNLRNFKQEDIDAFVISQLNKNGIKDIDFIDFLKRVDNNEFVIIFDGFDEMAHKIDIEEKRRNFFQIQKLIDRKRKKGKIILTSREEYFKSDAEIKDVFKNIEKSNYGLIHLCPFDDKQIKKYLQTHTKNAEFYWKKINEIFDLKDLAQRPVLLQLIIDNLTDVLVDKKKGEKIKASDLYEKCIDNELERKSKELSFLTIKLPSSERLELLQNLAVWMFLHDTLSIDIRIIIEELKLKEFFKSNVDWEIEKYLNNFLTFTFLIRKADYIFRISHKSFRDYLSALTFVKEINSGNIIHFARNNTTEEINHFIIEQNPRKKNLLNFIMNAENLPENKKWQGTNSAGILLKIDKSALKGLNLSDCQLSSVVFQDCDLSGTDFSNAILSNCQFNKTLLTAKFQNADFKNSSLDLRNTQISDIYAVKELKNLTSLYLSNTQISDIDAVKELKNLTSLDLRNTKISDIDAVKELKNLTHLVLWDTQIRDIESLKELNNLTYLDLDNTQISDIDAVKELKYLTYLYLSNTQISDIDAVKELKNLTYLDLDNTQISDIDAVKELKNLTDLYLSNTKIPENQIEELRKALPDISIKT